MKFEERGRQAVHRHAHLRLHLAIVPPAIPLYSTVHDIPVFGPIPNCILFVPIQPRFKTWRLIDDRSSLELLVPLGNDAIYRYTVSSRATRTGTVHRDGNGTGRYGTGQRG